MHVCLCVCVLRTEDALNIWCMLKAAVASIGSVCIQRPIKLCSHGEGVIGRVSLPTAYMCVCIYIYPKSNWPEYKSHWDFIFHLPFLSSSFASTESTQLSCFSPDTFQNLVTHFPSLLVALFLVSPVNMICLFRSVSTCTLSLQFCFTCCYLPFVAP